MKNLEDALGEMTLDFFGRSLHKITPAELFGKPDAVFLDLRSATERAILHVEAPWIRCIHIPLHELPTRWLEVPQDKFIGLFCSGDTRAAIAFAYFHARGYKDVRIVMGGYEALVAELTPGKVFKRLAAGD